MPRLLHQLGSLWMTVVGWGLFGAITVFVGALVVPLALLLGRRWPGARDRARDLTRTLLRAYVAVLPFMSLHIEKNARAEELKGARILVANHQSFLDPIVLLGIEPRLSGPARGYLMRTPFLRAFLRVAGFYEAESGAPAPMGSMRRAVERARERGEPLLFFPEGTRSKTGEIGPFHRGAFRLAYDYSLPIQPVVIEGLDWVLPPTSVFAQGGFRYPVRVRYLEPIFPPFGGDDRRSVVRALSDRVRGSILDSAPAGAHRARSAPAER